MLQPLLHTLLPGLGPLFLWGRGTSCGADSGAVVLIWAPGLWAPDDAARALSRAMVSLLGRRPLTPFLTGRGGSGVGRRYEDCMERRVCLDGEDEKEEEVEEEGADSGLGMVTAKEKISKLECGASLSKDTKL